MFDMCLDVFASAAELHQLLSFVGGGGDKGGGVTIALVFLLHPCSKLTNNQTISAFELEVKRSHGPGCPTRPHEHRAELWRIELMPQELDPTGSGRAFSSQERPQRPFLPLGMLCPPR